MKELKTASSNSQVVQVGSKLGGSSLLCINQSIITITVKGRKPCLETDTDGGGVSRDGQVAQL